MSGTSASGDSSIDKCPVPGSTCMTARGMSEGRRHDACVGDDNVEGPVCRIQGVCTGADARETGEIEFDKFELASSGRHIVAYPPGRRLSLFQVTRGADG